MGFQGDMNRFATKIRVTQKVIKNLVDDKVFDSITVGSATTGAPGQPVKTGALLRSWKKKKQTAGNTAMVTDCEYADKIENGVGPHGPLTLRSSVGGFHSLALTRAGFQALVDEAVEEVVG